MKKLCLVLFVLLTAFSCENEPIDSDLVMNDPNNPDLNEGESTGDYWPREIGNIWNFNDTYYGEVTYNMVSTETFDGNVYYKFDDLFGQESWLRKSGDSYYIRTALVGLPIEGYDVNTTILEIKILKDSAPVGGQWTSNVDYTITYTPTIDGYPVIPDFNYSATYNNEMMERDITRMVEGVEYNNVLHVKQTLISAGTSPYIVHYYFAKDIGLIEFTGDQSSGTLESYTLN